jgi:hypothetical protein
MFILYVAVVVCQQLGGKCRGMTYSIRFILTMNFLHYYDYVV